MYPDLGSHKSVRLVLLLSYFGALAYPGFCQSASASRTTGSILFLVIIVRVFAATLYAHGTVDGAGAM